MVETLLLRLPIKGRFWFFFLREIGKTRLNWLGDKCQMQKKKIYIWEISEDGIWKDLESGGLDGVDKRWKKWSSKICDKKYSWTLINCNIIGVLSVKGCILKENVLWNVGSGWESDFLNVMLKEWTQEVKGKTFF